MARYTIKDLENFTGIKSHTIRIWEQRYGLLQPNRTDTNIRFYSDEDLRKILNVKLLYDRGLKISRISSMSDQEVLDQVGEFLDGGTTHQNEVVEQFVRGIIDHDESRIKELLQEISEEKELDELYPQIIIPLLTRVGDLWQMGTISVSHEHFISNIIREFFIINITQQTGTLYSRGRVVLFLPEHEQHELSLLFYYYILKKRGFDCFYLGQSVPFNDLEHFVNVSKPDYLVCSLINSVKEIEIKTFFDQITSLIAPEKIFVGGIQTKLFKSKIPSKVNVINAVEDIKLN